MMTGGVFTPSEESVDQADVIRCPLVISTSGDCRCLEAYSGFSDMFFLLYDSPHPKYMYVLVVSELPPCTPPSDLPVSALHPFARS